MSRDVFAKLFFCQSKPIAFLLLQKLPIVVIQKFCYHSNVTSHYSSLFLCTEVSVWRLFNPVIPTQIFAQSHNPEGYFRYPSKYHFSGKRTTIYRG